MLFKYLTKHTLEQLLGELSLVYLSFATPLPITIKDFNEEERRVKAIFIHSQIKEALSVYAGKWILDRSMCELCREFLVKDDLPLLFQEIEHQDYNVNKLKIMFNYK